VPHLSSGDAEADLQPFRALRCRQPSRNVRHSSGPAIADRGSRRVGDGHRRSGGGVGSRPGDKPRCPTFADSCGRGRRLRGSLRGALPRAKRPCGFAVIALGKHGSRELNYSSDIDPILIFDPQTLPRRGAGGTGRGRGPPGAAHGRAACPRAMAMAMCSASICACARPRRRRRSPCRSRRRSAIMRAWRWAGSRPPSFARGCARATWSLVRIFPDRDSPVHLAAIARFRCDRRHSRYQPAHPRSLCQRAGVRTRL
jgi:hypothetical protein